MVSPVSLPTRLLVEEEPHEQPLPPPPPTSDARGVTWEAINLALKILSVRVLALMGHVVTLLSLSIAFFLWWSVMPSPNVYQLTGLGLYGLFALALVALKGK